MVWWVKWNITINEFAHALKKKGQIVMEQGIEKIMQVSWCQSQLCVTLRREIVDLGAQKLKEQIVTEQEIEKIMQVSQLVVLHW